MIPTLQITGESWQCLSLSNSFLFLLPPSTIMTLINWGIIHAGAKFIDYRGNRSEPRGVAGTG